MNPDDRNLVQVAVDIHTDLNKLAVGLQGAGASPQAVQSLQHMAGIVAELVKVLGSGAVGGAPNAPGGPQGQPAPGAPTPAQGAPAPAQPPVGGPPQGPRPGERPNGFHEATAQLQAALASKHAAAQKALAEQ